VKDLVLDTKLSLPCGSRDEDFKSDTGFYLHVISHPNSRKAAVTEFVLYTVSLAKDLPYVNWEVWSIAEVSIDQ
jgi:hypothetical protein